MRYSEYRKLLMIRQRAMMDLRDALEDLARLTERQKDVPRQMPQKTGPPIPKGRWTVAKACWEDQGSYWVLNIEGNFKPYPA